MLLPLELLRKRLQTEIQMARRQNIARIDYAQITSFPAKIALTFQGVATGYGQEGIRFEIEIHRAYPFRRPSVRCLSEVVHPNIAPASEGGFVCTRLLDEWRGERTIASVIAGIRELIEKPNFSEPLGLETCLRAAVEGTHGTSQNNRNAETENAQS